MLDIVVIGGIAALLYLAWRSTQPKAPESTPEPTVQRPTDAGVYRTPNVTNPITGDRGDVRAIDTGGTVSGSAQRGVGMSPSGGYTTVPGGTTGAPTTPTGIQVISDKLSLEELVQIFNATTDMLRLAGKPQFARPKIEWYQIEPGRQAISYRYEGGASYTMDAYGFYAMVASYKAFADSVAR